MIGMEQTAITLDRNFRIDEVSRYLFGSLQLQPMLGSCDNRVLKLLIQLREESVVSGYFHCQTSMLLGFPLRLLECV